MPQIIFFALVGLAAYVGYRSFVKVCTSPAGAPMAIT
jgi:hypothetical protein